MSSLITINMGHCCLTSNFDSPLIVMAWLALTGKGLHWSSTSCVGTGLKHTDTLPTFTKTLCNPLAIWKPDGQSIWVTCWGVSRVSTSNDLHLGNPDIWGQTEPFFLQWSHSATSEGVYNSSNNRALDLVNALATWLPGRVKVEWAEMSHTGTLNPVACRQSKYQPIIQSLQRFIECFPVTSMPLRRPHCQASPRCLIARGKVEGHWTGE